MGNKMDLIDDIGLRVLFVITAILFIAWCVHEVLVPDKRSWCGDTKTHQPVCVQDCLKVYSTYDVDSKRRIYCTDTVDGSVKNVSEMVPSAFEEHNEKG